MNDAIIVQAYRTAIGKIGGSLKRETPELLAAHLIQHLMSVCNIQATDVDEVILGQAKQTADLSNLARVASLQAKLPIEVPAYTVHRQCGSGLQAILNAAMQIQLGNSNVVICGGSESMSTAPYYVNQVRFGSTAGNIELKDPNTASQPGSQPVNEYGQLTMGLTADNIAKEYQISRIDQEKYSLQSQQRANHAMDNGRFDDQIVPYEVVERKRKMVFEKDEHPRETSLEDLAKLKTVFSKDGTVTAGTSSGRNDGASILLMMSKSKAIEFGYSEGLKLVSFANVGVEPTMMGLGPIPATKKALSLAGLTINDLDVIEINEAFAAQTLAFYKEFNLDMDDQRINPNGGAIALGHPIGATGAIITTKLWHEMNRRNARYGLVTLCIAGGLGIAAIFEKINF